MILKKKQRKDVLLLNIISSIFVPVILFVGGLFSKKRDKKINARPKWVIDEPPFDIKNENTKHHFTEVKFYYFDETCTKVNSPDYIKVDDYSINSGESYKIYAYPNANLSSTVGDAEYIVFNSNFKFIGEFGNKTLMIQAKTEENEDTYFLYGKYNGLYVGNNNTDVRHLLDVKDGAKFHNDDNLTAETTTVRQH